MTALDDILVGQSAPMREIKRLIELVAPSTHCSGSGRNRHWQRAGCPSRAYTLRPHWPAGFGELFCDTIRASESELSGHEKGAFTGAEKPEPAGLRQASGGTLFLDEIGDMPLALQAKLLRALNPAQFSSVGGGKDVAVDFRLVCATHQNIESQIDAGDFRADLYYRINVFPLSIPALANRAVDIPQLVERLCTPIAEVDDTVSLPEFADTAFAELMYAIHGRVMRELRNLMERACLLYPGRPISGDDVRNNLLRINS